MNMLCPEPGAPKRCGQSVDGIAAAGGFWENCSCGCALLNRMLGREKGPPARPQGYLMPGLRIWQAIKPMYTTLSTSDRGRAALETCPDC